jgi:hypothetical protein
MSTAPDTQSVTAAPAVVSKKAIRRAAPVVKFPCRLHCAITLAMASAFRRATAGNSLLAEADVTRLALHHYFSSTDAQYRAEVSNGAGNHA